MKVKLDLHITRQIANVIISFILVDNLKSPQSEFLVKTEPIFFNDMLSFQRRLSHQSRVWQKTSFYTLTILEMRLSVRYFIQNKEHIGVIRVGRSLLNAKISKDKCLSPIPSASLVFLGFLKAHLIPRL
jgi:hypothetical protein